jgi:hypothetical protein
MKKGDKAFFKCVGYGYTTFEECKVERIRANKIHIVGSDDPYDAKTGQRIGADLPDLGLAVSLCVSADDIDRARREIQIRRAS